MKKWPKRPGYAERQAKRDAARDERLKKMFASPEGDRPAKACDNFEEEDLPGGQRDEVPDCKHCGLPAAKH